MGATPGGVDGRAADSDDLTLDDNPVRLLQRHLVQERLRLLFPPGARVLDLGAQSGDEASFLAAQGVRAQRRDEGAGDLDGAYGSPEGLSVADLPRAGSAIVRTVRPGGRVLLCLAGSHVSPTGVRRTLGRRFQWTNLLGLGILLPAPERADWARRNPQAFGVLAALEGIVRSWPVLRTLGDHFILEGRVADVRSR